MIQDLLKASEHMDDIMYCYRAMPLEDLDGGDEDDALVKQRQFLRACRQPRAKVFREGQKLYVVQMPDPLQIILPIQFEQREPSLRSGGAF